MRKQQRFVCDVNACHYSQVLLYINILLENLSDFIKRKFTCVSVFKYFWRFFFCSSKSDDCETIKNIQFTHSFIHFFSLVCLYKILVSRETTIFYIISNQNVYFLFSPFFLSAILFCSPFFLSFDKKNNNENNIFLIFLLRFFVFLYVLCIFFYVINSLFIFFCLFRQNPKSTRCISLITCFCVCFSYFFFHFCCCFVVAISVCSKLCYFYCFFLLFLLYSV